MALLKQMPEGYAEVFNLFVIDEYSHAEIATLLHIPEFVSRKRLSRAKEWLKARLPQWSAGTSALEGVLQVYLQP